MNFLTHFFSGYAMARSLKNQNDRFETFYLSVAATIPDFDIFIGVIWPDFAHGVFSHTIIGGLLFAFVFFGLSFLVLRSFLAEVDVKFTRLLGLTLLGLASHFLLDIITYIRPLCITDAHLYFWPISDFSFHMNCIWPGVDYTVRILVEVGYTAVIVGAILFYDWIAKKHNPFFMFVPKFWWRYSKNNLPAERMPKTAYIYLCVWAVVEILALVKYGW